MAHYYLSVGLQQESQNIAGNYSRVTVSVVITASPGAWAQWNGGCSGTLVINGESHPFTSSYYINGSSQVLYATTVTVPHNSDGTKTVSAYASFDAKPSFVGWLTASNGLTLSTIPRGSKINSIAGSEFGDTYTIKWTPASDTFTHRVYWHILDENEHPWVLVNTGLIDKCSFEVPLELCSKIPNDRETTLTISLETYSGKTKIWDEIRPYTIKVPSNVAPAIESKTITEGNLSLPAEFEGLWVQGISRPKIEIKAKGIYGSTIKSIKTTFEEASYDGAEVVFNPIKADGELKSKTIVTDSRGRTIEYIHTYQVVHYHEPQIKNLTFTFCDANGQSDPSGTFIKISTSGKIADVNNTNLRVLNLKWRKQTAQSFANKSVQLNSYEFDTSTVIGGFDPTLTYELVAELFDAHAKSKTSIFTGKIVMSLYPGGGGVTFFDEATEEGLNCRGMRYDLDEDEIDLLKIFTNTQHGLVRLGDVLFKLGLCVPLQKYKDGQFDVVKYSDGTCEASCQIKQITPVNMIQVNPYLYRWIGNLILPNELFTSVDNVQVTGHYNAGIFTCGAIAKTDRIQIIHLMPNRGVSANQVPEELPFVKIHGRYK
jgi:hypothetical protein|nr:MAG TPA: protein of unknown function DUF859 [Caudoviricetes sp.]